MVFPRLCKPILDICNEDDNMTVFVNSDRELWDALVGKIVHTKSVTELSGVRKGYLFSDNF